MTYIYPLQGIIEAPHLETILGEMHEAVMRNKRIPHDKRLIKAAREEFFAGLNYGENEFHRFMIDLFSPFLGEYKILWKVNGKCEKHRYEKPQRKERLDTPHKIQTIIYGMNDEKRTRKFMPRCDICGEMAYPTKSFFIYNPINSQNKRWAEIRIKEASAKVTDKIFEINPLREGGIPTEFGEIVQDLFAGRIVVESYRSVKSIIEHSKNFFEPGFQIKNYHENPKENGYSAVHLIGKTGIVCEVQLKTFDENKIAEDPESSASHEKREKELMMIRMDTPRWQEVWEVLKKVVSPNYERIYCSE